MFESKCKPDTLAWLLYNSDFHRRSQLNIPQLVGPDKIEGGGKKSNGSANETIVFRVKLSQQRSAMDYSLSLTNKRGPHNYVEVISRRSIWKNSEEGIRRVYCSLSANCERLAPRDPIRSARVSAGKLAVIGLESLG